MRTSLAGSPLLGWYIRPTEPPHGSLIRGRPRGPRLVFSGGFLGESIHHLNLWTNDRGHKRKHILWSWHTYTFSSAPMAPTTRVRPGIWSFAWTNMSMERQTPTRAPDDHWNWCSSRPSTVLVRRSRVRCRSRDGLGQEGGSDSRGSSRSERTEPIQE